MKKELCELQKIGSQKSVVNLNFSSTTMIGTDNMGCEHVFVPTSVTTEVTLPRIRVGVQTFMQQV